MTMFRFGKTCAVLLVAVCFAVTAVPVKDLVLCIGPHGHVALEFAQDGCCSVGPCERVDGEGLVPMLNPDDHGCRDCVSCVDIPISQGPVVGSSSSSAHAKKLSPEFGHVPPIATSPSGMPDTKALCAFSLQSSGGIAPSSSSILRI